MQVRIGLIATVVAAVFCSLCSTGFAATPGWECVPTTAGQAVTSGGTSSSPSCGSSSTAVLAPTYVAAGVGGKATVQFGVKNAGVNVQVLNGTGSESTLNGEGNLVVGYDSPAGTQTGSHNLLLGSNQTDTSYGGIDAGSHNTISGPDASVSGGVFNIASGTNTSVSGGQNNTAADGPGGGNAWVGGGNHNLASNVDASVSGGQYNQASDQFASIIGGCYNQAGPAKTLIPVCQNYGSETVSGGTYNSARGLESSVSGGDANQANQEASSILGGYHNIAAGYNSTISGGADNATDAASSEGSVSGGQSNHATGYESSVLGGNGNRVVGNCGTFPATGQSC